MKQIRKWVVLSLLFTVPIAANSQGCNCYGTFNTGWQAATSNHNACLFNLLFTPVAAWGGYFGGNSGAAVGGSFTAIGALQRCNSTYNSTWEDLGDQFNACIRENCQ